MTEFDFQPFCPVRLSNFGGSLVRVHEFLYRSVDTKLEMLVYGILFWLTVEHGGSNIKVSHSKLATLTGLRATNVRRALKSLVKSGQIVIAEPPSSNTTTVFEVPIAKKYAAHLLQKDK